MEVSTQVLKKIRRIQIHTKHLVSGFLSGAYVSSFKGSGVVFEELREYVFGDEVRNIDWKATAKMGSPYIKRYVDERERVLFLLVDVSSSMLFASKNQSKSDLMLELLASLTLSAMSNQDKVGAIFFDEKVRLFLPPKRGVRHFLRILREAFLLQESAKETNLDQALEFFLKIQKKRCACFLISDFLMKDEPKSLPILAKKHELMAMHIQDVYEQTFPDIGLMTLEGLENEGELEIDSSSLEFRELFQNYSQERIRQIKERMGKLGASYLSLSTEEDLTNILVAFFHQRGKRSC